MVAIILIDPAIAIPNLLRARIAANESSAVSSVRTINTAEVINQSAYPTVGYAATLVALGPGAGLQACPAGGPTQAAACLVDGALASNIAAGGKERLQGQRGWCSWRRGRIAHHLRRRRGSGSFQPDRCASLLLG